MSGAIDESGSEYELIQPAPVGRMAGPTGYAPHSPASYQTPRPSPVPKYRPPRPPRLSYSSRQRKYTELGVATSSSIYTTPYPTGTGIQRPTHLRYDRFFENSVVSEEGEEEGPEQSLISEVGQSKKCNCSCSCGCFRKLQTYMCLLLLATLMISLAALGLGLYHIIAQGRSCQPTQCNFTTLDVAPVDRCYLNVSYICHSGSIDTSIGTVRAAWMYVSLPCLNSLEHYCITNMHIHAHTCTHTHTHTPTRKQTKLTK